MTMYVKVGDERLPPEVDPDAPRFEAVVHRALPERYRLPLGAAGAVATLGGAGLLALGVPWGIMGLIAGVAALVGGLTGGKKTTRFREAADGPFVKVSPELEAETLEELWRKPVRAWERIGAGILGLTTAAIVLRLLLPLEFGSTGWETLVIMAFVAATLLYVAIRGNLPILDPQLRPPPPRFYEFADPTRPLPPETFQPARALPGRTSEAELQSGKGTRV